MYPIHDHDPLVLLATALAAKRRPAELLEIMAAIDLIANRQSGETARQVGLLHAQLHYGRISGILEHGLHEWLEDFMDRIYLLGDGISKDFLVPMAEVA